MDNIIKQMIAELCPKGVEYKTVKEIAIDIYRGSGIKRDHVTETGVPCVRYGEIYTTYGLFIDECVSHTNPEFIKTKKYLEHGDIIFAITGESVEDIAKSCAYIGEDKCLAGGDTVVLKHKQNPKYLSYVLDSTSVRKQKSAGKIKTKVVHSSVPDIEKIVIPVPPIEVQEKIVDVLDSLTQTSNELISALESEINYRHLQFELVRKRIFEDITDGRTLTIQDVCTQTCSGGTPDTSHSEYYGGEIPWLRTQEVDWKDIYDTDLTITQEGMDNSSAKWVPENSVIVAMYGATAAKSAITKISLTTNQACCNLQIDKDIADYNYVYYWLTKEYLSLKAKGRGSQHNINAKIIKEYPIVLPEMERQLQIVKQLDNLTQVYNALYESLLEEIEKRRIQYSACRDAILEM